MAGSSNEAIDQRKTLRMQSEVLEPKECDALIQVHSPFFKA